MNNHEVTFVILFPLEIKAPRIQKSEFPTMKTVVLSFTQIRWMAAGDTVQYKASGHIPLKIPGIFPPLSPGSATIVDVLKQDKKLTVTCVVSDHMKTIMTQTDHADGFVATLNWHVTDIKAQIIHQLKPISDAILAVNNGWVRQGKNGLFSLMGVNTLKPLEDRFVPSEWDPRNS